MTWRDAVALASRSVRRRPGRTALTILAVALAAALLTALVTIATTAQTRVLDQLAKGGPLSGIKVAAAEPDPLQAGQDNARPGPPKDLGDGAVQEIRALPDVRDALPVVTADVFVVQPSTTPTGAPLEPFDDDLVGVDLTNPNVLPLSIIAGRLPGPASTGEVTVSESYLRRLGLDRAHAASVLGQSVELGSGRTFANDTLAPDGDPQVRGLWTRSVIVGVVAQDAGSGDFLVPITEARRYRDWTAASLDPGREFGLSTSPYSGVFVVARGLDQVASVRNEITAVGYSTSAPENLIASVRRYLHVVEIVLGAIGLVALIVATLGIANAMLAAVRERQREIGVLKAIGARDRDIRRIFVVEAGTVGFVGGVLGSILGFGAAELVGLVVNNYLHSQGLETVALNFPLAVVLASVAGATIMALMGGLVPARRAARLSAREAVSA
jgi:putative ABC transport system permease protein